MTSDVTKAALAGQACGDSFAAAFEFQPNAADMARISMVEKRYVCSKNDVGQSRSDFWRMPGVYTDDTQQALLLMWLWESLDDPRDGRKVRKEFMRWCQLMAKEDILGAQYGIHRGTGGNFRHAVNQGRAVKTAGLGGPMRVGPVATMIEDPARLPLWMTQVTLATTNDPLSLAGTVFFAMVCWMQAHPGQINGPDDWGPLPDVIAPVWSHYMNALNILRTDGEEGLIDFGMRNGSNKQLQSAADGFALTGVPWAIFHGVSAPSYSQALVDACQSGGDTDTVCAMTGCLAALRHGIKNIPSWMTEQLVGWEHIQEPSTWDIWESEVPMTEADVDFRRNLRLRQLDAKKNTGK